MENEDEVESLSVSDSTDSSEEYTADLEEEEEEEEELDLAANNEDEDEDEDEPCVTRSVPSDQDRKSKNVDALLRSVQSDFVNSKAFQLQHAINSSINSVPLPFQPRVLQFIWRLQF